MMIRRLAVILSVTSVMLLATGVDAANTRLEIEPNDTFATANAIKIAEGQFGGQLSSGSDKDYYVFSTSSGVVTFRVKAAVLTYAPIGPWIASILNSSGAVLASKAFNTNEEETVYANLNAGTYYLEIRYGGGAVVGRDYLIDSSSTAIQTSTVGALENPQAASVQTGITAISGWHCGATLIQISIDEGPLLLVPYGSLRGDTQATCGRISTGFSYLLNYNTLTAGSHTVRVFADGALFGSATITTVKPGGEFISGVSASYWLNNFPKFGVRSRVTWSEAKQNFSLTETDDMVD